MAKEESILRGIRIKGVGNTIGIGMQSAVMPLLKEPAEPRFVVKDFDVQKYYGDNATHVSWRTPAQKGVYTAVAHHVLKAQGVPVPGVGQN